MQNKRKIRVGNHIIRKGKDFGKKQSMIYLTLIFLLLSINTVLLCRIQVQMKRIQNMAVILNELTLSQKSWDKLKSDGQDNIAGYGVAGYGTTEYDSAGHDTAGYDTADHSIAGYDSTGHGTTGYDTAGHGTAGYDSTGRGTTGYDTAGRGTTGYDSAKHGITGYNSAGGATASGDTISTAEVDYVTLCGLSKVDAPVRRNRAEALVRLKELAEENEVISEIYKNSKSYSENMLGALANNPEMADFVAGYLDAPAEATGEGLTELEKKQDYPLFLQWDPRWGYAEYGDNSNIGLAGCGPVCLSMALYYLLGDESLTPDKIAEYSMKNGYYVSGTGTAWSLLSDVPAQYGVKVSQPGITEQTMKKALDEGKIIICSMKPGDFTAIGHFIVIYGYDDEGFQVNDPNCVARSREHWLYGDIGNQIKHIWVLGEKKLDTSTRVE